MTIDMLEAQGTREQGTLAWRVARLGRFTASTISDLMKKGRGKEQVFGDTAITLIAGVAGERKIAQDVLNSEEKFQEYSDLQCAENRAMRHGHEYEGIARSMYEIQQDANVQECGLLLSKDVAGLAASPDGVLCDTRGTIKGCIEIKCPSTIKTFQRYLWNIIDGPSLKAEKEQYYWQVQTVMAVTGAKWCDFIIYFPYMQEGKEMKVVRIERNEEDIAEILNRVKLANAFIDEQEAKLYGGKQEPKDERQSEFTFPDDLEKQPA